MSVIRYKREGDRLLGQMRTLMRTPTLENLTMAMDLHDKARSELGDLEHDYLTESPAIRELEEKLHNRFEEWKTACRNEQVRETILKEAGAGPGEPDTLAVVKGYANNRRTLVMLTAWAPKEYLPKISAWEYTHLLYAPLSVVLHLGRHVNGEPDGSKPITYGAWPENVRETALKIWDPRGRGPLESLAEAVRAAKALEA